MNKRILCLIIIFVFSFTAYVVPSYAVDESIYVDGKKLTGRRILTYEHQTNDVGFPYSAIAKELGYTTSFNEETNTVTSQKGDKTLSFKIGGVKVSVKNGNESTYFALRQEAIVKDGTTYIMGFDISQMFNLALYRDNENSGYEFYSIDIYKEMLRSNCKNLISIIKGIAIPQEFSNNQSVEGNFNATSDLFGVNINGESKVNISLERKAEKFKISFSMDNKGIMNFYDLFLSQPFVTGLNHFDKMVDLEKPLAIEAYMDQEALFVKSDILLLIYLYENYNYPIENIKKAYTMGRDNFIEIPLTKEVNKKIAEVLSFIEQQEKDEEGILDSLVSSIMVMSRDLGDYETIGKVFNIAVDLFNDKNLIVKKDGSKEEIKLTITAQMLKDTAKKYFIFDSKDEQNIFNLLNFDVNLSLVTNGTEQTNATDLIIKLSNIPNKYGIKCGSIEISTKILNKMNYTVEDIIKPKIENVIKSSELEEQIKNPIVDIEEENKE